MAHYMTEITRLTAAQDEYLLEVAELTGRNMDLNYSNFAKVNNQNDQNFDQNKIVIEYSKNYLGYILAKERRRSEIDINQTINGIQTIAHQMKNSEKNMIIDIQCAILRTYPRLSMRHALFIQLPLFYKTIPKEDEFLKELIRVLEDTESYLDYKPEYETRVVSNEEWIRFILTLNTT